MKRLLVLLVLAFAFAFVIVIVSPRLAVADATVEQTAERMVVLIEKMASITDTYKNDCDAMGGALDKFADATAEERAALKAARAKLTREQKDAIAKKYEARLAAGAAKIAAGMRACGSNPKVKAAMVKIGSVSD